MCFPSTAHKVRARRVRGAQLALTHSVRACVGTVGSGDQQQRESAARERAATAARGQPALARGNGTPRSYRVRARCVFRDAEVWRNSDCPLKLCFRCRPAMRAATSRVRDVCCMRVSAADENLTRLERPTRRSRG